MRVKIINGYNIYNLYFYFYTRYFMDSRYDNVSVRLLKKIVLKKYLGCLYGK